MQLTLTYFDLMEAIHAHLKSKNIEWRHAEYDDIWIEFKKPVYKEVYTILLTNNLLKYYDQFVELGASSVEDFEYVEHNDLIKMDMNSDEIENFKQINPNI